jgi:hypothetical protein
VKTRVRVDRKKLTDAVKTRLSAAEREHKRLVEGYGAKVAAWNAAQAKQLDRLAAKAHKGELDAGDSSFAIAPQPEPPVASRDLCSLRRALRTLELAVGDYVLVSHDDAGVYFGDGAL